VRTAFSYFARPLRRDALPGRSLSIAPKFMPTGAESAAAESPHQVPGFNG
jgi:hypothetical protein